MWPFSSTKRAEATPYNSPEEWADVKLRLKTLEREHDDLHRAYRKLRGEHAQEVQASRKAPAQLELQDDPREPGFDKDALRRKYLARRPGGNGQT
jgi:hypothetical protein